MSQNLFIAAPISTFCRSSTGSVSASVVHCAKQMPEECGLQMDARMEAYSMPGTSLELLDGAQILNCPTR